MNYHRFVCNTPSADDEPHVCYKKIEGNNYRLHKHFIVLFVDKASDNFAIYERTYSLQKVLSVRFAESVGL